MITKKAARQLAYDILHPYMVHKLADDETVENVTRLIISAVKLDEVKQQNEIMKTLVESRVQ